MQAASERLKQDLCSAIHDMHADLERVEILAACLHAFNAPVPDYEPMFRHLDYAGLDRHELDDANAR